MKFFDRLKIAHYHRKRYRQFGKDRARTLGWADKYSQISRFEALCRGLTLDGSSILDIGCGYGDLLAFIELTGGFLKAILALISKNSLSLKPENEIFARKVSLYAVTFQRWYCLVAILFLLPDH